MNLFKKSIIKIAGILLLTLVLLTVGGCDTSDPDPDQGSTESQQETEKTTDTTGKEGEIFKKQESINFNSLEVNVAMGAFNYLSGDNEKNGYDIYWNEESFEDKVVLNVYKENNELVIGTDPQTVVNINTNNEKLKKENRITVFKDGQALEEADIYLGIGFFNIENLKADELNLATGIGDLRVDGLEVLDEGNIKTGVGSVKIHKANIHDLDLKTGVGAVTIEGVLTGETEIKSGIGKITLKIHGNLEDYRFDLHKGIGRITINGSPYQNVAVSDSGPHTIKIDSGVQDIAIEFVN